MKILLTLEERDRLMELLTEEQRRFVHDVLVRGRRTLFARQLAQGKCQFIPEDAEPEEMDVFIEEWDYIGFTDSGAISPHTKCECGRSLRYQHKVMHVPTGTLRYFGIDHLQLHTGIDASIIGAIMKGFDILDNELHEVLFKHRDGWRLEHHVYWPLPEELALPRDIRDQLDAGLPLLDRQLQRLRTKLKELERGKRRVPHARRAPVPYIHEEIRPHKDVDESVQEQQVSFLFDEVEPSIDKDGQMAFLFDEVDEDKAKGPVSLTVAGHSSDTGSTIGVPTAPAVAVVPSIGPQGLFLLTPECRSVIDNALPRGRVSSLAVSEFLIEQRLASSRRMSTGKPDIYIAVASYLDSLVAAGLCELADASPADRVYRRISAE